MTTGPRLTPLQLFQTRVHLFHMGVRKRLTVGARAVLLDREKVLLIRHTYLPGWQFPGGGVEPGETAEMAAAREALEETGYAVAGGAALHGLYLNRIAGGARDHVALYVWRAATKQRDFRPGLEIAACQWFDLKRLPDDIDPGTARRLRELVDGGPPDGEW